MPATFNDPPANHAEFLIVGGRSYVFGLRWTSAASRSTLRREAQAAAIAEAANFVALHPALNQFGLAAIADPPTGPRAFFHRPLSGAATVALTVGAATLAAFPLADGRWLVLAIDRTGILPDGDLIVANAETAKQRIARLIAQSPANWRRTFLPEDWGIAGSRTVNPAELLSRGGAPRLLPLWSLIHRKQIRLGIGAIVATILVTMLRFATMPTPVTVIPFEPPKPVAAIWTPAALSLDRCLSAVRDAQRYAAIPGWIPARYACAAGDSVATTFTRATTGQISVLRAFLPQAQLAEDGRSATLTLPLSPLPLISAIGGFAPRRRYQSIGLDVAQRLNGGFTLQPEKKPLPGETVTPPSNRSWTAFGWSYQTRAPAIVWAGAIARFGAISLETLAFDPADHLWQLTGSLYAIP